MRIKLEGGSMIEDRSRTDEEDLDLINEDEEPLEPDSSPEATAEAGLTEGEHQPAEGSVEFEEERGESDQ
jgi:hypothetical protein